MGVKIVVAGIGGVGGYYGGLLAKNYIYDKDVEVFFLARGKHLAEIVHVGLKVKTETGTFVAQPKLATDNGSKIGVADYVILTTKSYDLDSIIEQLKPCINKNTIILPLLNGIDISTRIKELLPANEVWYGCVYIVGRVIEPGMVASTGNVHSLYFGSLKQTERLLQFEKILKNADIEAVLSKDILSVIWQKFFFISTTATLTSYFNVTFGGLLSDLKKKETLLELLDELYSIAIAEGIQLDISVKEKVIKQLENLPFETTSSMHSDFLAGKSTTELETLTGIVIRLAEKHNIKIPVYQKVYSFLKSKIK